MNESANTTVPVAKAGTVLLLAWVDSFFDWAIYLVYIYAAVMLVDIAMGFNVASKSGTWESRVAKIGLRNKAGCWGIIAAAGAFDILVFMAADRVPMFSNVSASPMLFFPIALIWYILTEIGSILENGKKLGAPIPAFFEKAILALKSQTEKKGEEFTAEGDNDEH